MQSYLLGLGGFVKRGLGVGVVLSLMACGSEVRIEDGAGGGGVGDPPSGGTGTGTGTSTSVGGDTGGGGDDSGPLTFAGSEGLNYLALSPSINPVRPLVFIVEVTVEGESFYMEWQPLAAADLTTPVGDAVLFGPYDLEATSIQLGTFGVTGSANPLSGSDLEFSELELVIVDGPVLCGDVDAEIVKPLPLDLAGSAFRMVPLGQELFPPLFDCQGNQADAPG